MYEKYLFRISPLVGIYVYKGIDPCVCMGMVQTPKINISGHTNVDLAHPWFEPRCAAQLGLTTTLLLIQKLQSALSKIWS